jgi:hypothetical protein
MSESPDREERRRRREALRRAHPDLGGDPEDFLRVTQSFRAGRIRPGAVAGDEVRFVRRPTGLARVSGWCGSRWRRWRRPPPRRVV